MILKFWGTRGSIPVPGNSTLKYGGNTPCVEIRSESNEILILDAGSGIRELGKNLSNDYNGNSFNILFSHYHWDHIQGIPFFLPLYDKGKVVSFWGEHCGKQSVESVLSYQMTSNYFPIKMKELSAKVNFKEIKINDKFALNGMEISTFRANHSSPTVTYKISEKGKCIVYMTDNELNVNEEDEKDNIHSVKELNKDLIDFCRGCDYLIHDSMYDESAMLHKKGWGHTSNVTLAFFGILAEVKNLVLFHYNPDYSDDKIDSLLEETQKVLQINNSGIKCIAAREEMSIPV